MLDKKTIKEIKQIATKLAETQSNIMKENKQLRKLWRELIELDDQDWNGGHWSDYIRKWQSIKARAYKIIDAGE